DVFTIDGTARFVFGGGLGFRLDDLRVSGFSLFGAHATIPIGASGTQLRAPRADLSSPFNGELVSALVFDQSNAGHIDVVYTDYNNQGLNAGSVTDDTPEFTLN